MRIGGVSNIHALGIERYKAAALGNGNKLQTPALPPSSKELVQLDYSSAVEVKISDKAKQMYEAAKTAAGHK